jgi:hypothetical protein
VNITDGDRRLLPFTTSSEYAKPEDGDPHYDEIENKRDAYFGNLNDEINDELFYPTLYTYFMTVDLTKFKAREFPRTKERTEIIEENKPAYEQVIIETILKYVEGVRVEEAYNDYTTLCQRCGFKGVLNINSFGRKIKDWVDKKRTNTGERYYYYVFNGEGLKHFHKFINEAKQYDKEAFGEDETKEEKNTTRPKPNISISENSVNFDPEVEIIIKKKSKKEKKEIIEQEEIIKENPEVKERREEEERRKKECSEYRENLIMDQANNKDDDFDILNLEIED